MPPPPPPLRWRCCSWPVLLLLLLLLSLLAQCHAQQQQQQQQQQDAPAAALIGGQQPAEAGSAPPLPPPPPACCALLLGALNFSSNLPVVLITTLANDSASPAQAALEERPGPYLPAAMCVCGGRGAVPRRADGVAPAGPGGELPVRLKVRGSSSAVEYAKKSLALETLSSLPQQQAAVVAAAAALADDSSTSTNPSGPAQQRQQQKPPKRADVALLGLPADSTWVLYGPENDRTLGMRNWLAYAAARETGRYASRTVMFELFLRTTGDGAAPTRPQDYRGVYQLQERVARGPHRVDVAKYNASLDPSGGFIWSYENDNIESQDVIFELRLSRLTMLLDYPGGGNSDARERAAEWLQGFLNRVEAALLTQPTADLTAQRLFDVAAAVDYFLATELTKNPDGFRGSIKMHKDRGGPAVMGPVWDYNEAFGVCCGYPIEGYQRGGQSNGTSGGSAVSAAGWRFNICQDAGRCRVEPADGVSQWYRALWRQGAFRAGVARRWAELRANKLADGFFDREVSRLSRELAEPGARNFARWAQAINNASAVYGPQFADFPSLFAAETGQLRAWLLARLRWMDAALALQADPAAPPDAYLGVPWAPEPPLAGSSV